MYKEYHPSPLLSPYIDKYWEFKGQPGYGMHINILPDGCTDFIFTLGEAPKAVHDSLVMQPYHTYFIGAMTKYSELVTHTVTVHMLGSVFCLAEYLASWTSLCRSSPTTVKRR